MDWSHAGRARLIPVDPAVVYPGIRLEDTVVVIDGGWEVYGDRARGRHGGGVAL